jgi:hypothetical protein
MNQRAYLGGRPTLLDVAKGAVETFVKVGLVPTPPHRPFYFFNFFFFVNERNK